VGGCGNICFGHVLVAVRQGQRRGAAATGEEQLGRCAARKNKDIRLYVYSGLFILAATYLRRVFADGRSLAAGAPALKNVCTVGVSGKKNSAWASGSPAGRRCVAARFLVPQPNGKHQNFAGPQRVDSFGVDSRFEKFV